MTTPAGFDRFWSRYPKKVGKGAAVKAWEKQGLSRNQWLQDAIAKALEWQVLRQEWTEQGGKFIPHPSTWLNRWQWEDERPKKAQSYQFDCPHDPHCGGRNACHIKQQIAQAKAS